MKGIPFSFLLHPFKSESILKSQMNRKIELEIS